MTTKGKQLAVWGVVLQCGYLVLKTVAVIALIRAFQRISTTDPTQSEALAASISLALYPFCVGVLLFVAGAVLLMMALIKAKYRAAWFQTAMWIISVLWLFAVPIGTILGIIGIVYLRKHKTEFV